MKKSLLEMDPDADALLILHSPNLQQVHAVKAQDLLNEKEKVEPSSIASTRNEKRRNSETPTEIDVITSLKPFQENDHPNVIEFRVSSKHLCMASPVFRKMIKGNFRESRPNSNGFLEITASDWNASALLILLDIIHGHHRQVPRRPNVDTIVQIGILVDYYDCAEIVEIFFDRWAVFIPDWWNYSFPSDNLKNTKPFGEPEVLLLFIAYVFQKPVAFRLLAAHATRATYGPIQTRLPLPSQILDKIEEDRIDEIDRLFSGLYDLQGDLLTGLVGCGTECSCRLLGCLMRQMRDMNLPIMKPEKPFLGFSIFSVRDIILGIDTPVWSGHKHNGDYCDLRTNIFISRNGLDSSDVRWRFLQNFITRT